MDGNSRHPPISDPGGRPWREAPSRVGCSPMNRLARQLDDRHGRSDATIRSSPGDVEDDQDEVRTDSRSDDHRDDRQDPGRGVEPEPTPYQGPAHRTNLGSRTANYTLLLAISKRSDRPPH